MKQRASVSLSLFVVLSLFSAYADLITQWNFNSVPPDGSTSTGTNVPSVGYGTAVLIGGDRKSVV